MPVYGTYSGGALARFPLFKIFFKSLRRYLNYLGDGFVTQNNTAQSVRVSKHHTPGCEHSLENGDFPSFNAWPLIASEGNASVDRTSGDGTGTLQDFEFPL